MTALWSSSWVLIRWGLDDESLRPVTFAGLRYGLAAAVVAAWVLVRPRSRRELANLTARTRVRLVVLGLVLYSLTQGAQFVAIDRQPAATTSLVLSATPLLVVAISSRSIGEGASGVQFLGAALVAVGAAVYFAGELGATAVGLTAALVGLIANASSALLGRDVNRERVVSPQLVTAVSMTVGATVLVGAGLVVEGMPSVSGRALAIIAWLAIVNTAVAFTLWNRALRHLSAVESAGINNTMLIQIGVLAWVFLDERLGAPEIVAMVLVSVGVFLTQTRATIGAQRGPSALDRHQE